MPSGPRAQLHTRLPCPCPLAPRRLLVLLLSPCLPLLPLSLLLPLVCPLFPLSPLLARCPPLSRPPLPLTLACLVVGWMCLFLVVAPSSGNGVSMKPPFPCSSIGMRTLRAWMTNTRGCEFGSNQDCYIRGALHVIAGWMLSTLRAPLTASGSIGRSSRRQASPQGPLAVSLPRPRSSSWHRRDLGLGPPLELLMPLPLTGPYRRLHQIPPWPLGISLSVSSPPLTLTRMRLGLASHLAYDRALGEVWLRIKCMLPICPD